MAYDRDAGLDTPWAIKTEEEKYAEWSRFWEDAVVYFNVPDDPRNSYVNYCNRWDKEYGVANAN